MHPDADLIHRDLGHDEGLRLQAYDDATGNPVPPGGSYSGNLTIGVGRNLDGNPLTQDEIAVVGHDGRSAPITAEQAYYLLDNDLAAVYARLSAHIPWWESLTEVRARVVAELCFNMGWGDGLRGLSSFKNTLGAIAKGLYNQAATGLMASRWAQQVGSRANRLTRMLASGYDIAP